MVRCGAGMNGSKASRRFIVSRTRVAQAIPLFRPFCGEEEIEAVRGWRQ